MVYHNCHAIEKPRARGVPASHCLVPPMWASGPWAVDPEQKRKYVLRYILDTSIYIIYIIYLTDYLSPLKPSVPGYMSSSYQVLLI